MTNDDEREALIASYEGWDFVEVALNPHGASRVIADLANRLDRALRRSEPQGEPSDAQVLDELIGRAQSIVNQMRSSAGRRTSPNEWCYVRFGQVESLDEVLRVMGRVSVPLDAVVEAGADELWRRLTRVGTVPGPSMSECEEIMRAALRAASATEQGENR